MRVGRLMTRVDSSERYDSTMSLFAHLAELRKRIIISICAIAFGSIVAYIFYSHILDFLLAPHCQLVEASTDSCELLALSPLEGFSVRLTVSGYCGLAFAMPVILWQIWVFVVPALYPREKRYGTIFVAASSILFILGAVLAYWSLPKALEFLINVGGENLNNFFRPKEYVGFVVKMMIGAGIGFEFPIILIFAQLVGLINSESLRKGRRWAIVGIVSLVAVLTPSGDPITLIVLSVPMYLFYETSIIIGTILQRRSPLGL